MSAGTRWGSVGQADSTCWLAAVALLGAIAVCWGLRAQGQTAFSSSSEDVVIAVPSSDGVRLAGTLIVPDGEGPFPAVVLVSGAGAHDRDATNAGHKPFAVLAQHLASQGVAVLRTDGRGVGGSTGSLGGTTWLDLAADVRAGVDFLRTRAKINPKAIGIVGHSQGGLIAPIVVTGDPQVAFLVSLAGPSTDFIELTLSQRRRAAVAQGISEEVIARTESVLAEAFAAIARADTLPAARASVQRILTAEALARLGAPETARDAVAGQLASAELFVALQHTPQRVLPRVRVPVLALTGALDSIVDADANLAVIAAALVGNPDVTTVKLEGLNHFFQTAVTGDPSEYADLEEDFAQVALDAISRWIGNRFGSP